MGLGFPTWTVNEPVRIRQLLGMGIRNITTRKSERGPHAAPGRKSVMILLRERYRWKPEDSKTNVRFSFECPEEVISIRILFSFEPDSTDRTGGLPPHDRQGLSADIMMEEVWSMTRFLRKSIGPLKNLITISLYKRTGVI